MTKKKRGHPTIEEILERPWCYYCERDFDDFKVLISHQKAKHFKCERCGRRLNTAGGLSVHMNQVHKETLTAVENALPNRTDLGVEIFAMEGIPEEVKQQHNQRVIQQFHQNEAERRMTTGNPTPGTMNGSAPKKSKTESAEERKQRLAEWKARKAAGGNPAEEVAGNAPGSEADESPQEPLQAEHNGVPAAYGQPYLSTQASPPPPFQQPFGQPNNAVGHSPYPYQQPPGMQHGPPGYGGPPPQYPPGMAPYQQPPFAHHHAPPFQQPPMYGAGSPPPPGFPLPGHSASPQQNAPFARPISSGPPPGLPSRPSFAPPVQYPNQGPPTFTPPTNGSYGQGQVNGASMSQPPSAHATSVDDLIASVAKESEHAEAAKSEPAPDPSTDKKSKKEKEKNKPTRMIYSDDVVSPEEKMAKLSRYAFDPAQKKEETVLGDAGGAAVTGTVAD